MWRASAIIGLLLAVGASEPSWAAATFTAKGNVPIICSVQPPELLSTHPAINVTSVTGNTLTITQLADRNTLAAKAASFDVGFAAVCNLPKTVVVESQFNGLWRQSAQQEAPGFADAVPYTTTVTWGNAQGTLSADATVRKNTEVAVPVTTSVSDPIDLHFEILPGASNSTAWAPLLAGTYQDTILVTVVPQ